MLWPSPIVGLAMPQVRATGTAGDSLAQTLEGLVKSAAHVNARRLGGQLEHAIDIACERYARRGIAKIGHIPTPVAITGVNARGGITGRLEARQWCDYLGVALCQIGTYPAGTAIAIEAKATAADSLPYSAIDEHQRAWLEAAPLGFVLVWFTAPNVCRLVPWRDMGARGSVKPTDGWQVTAVDFLEPLLRMGGKDAD